jgi:hypothetical protein
MSRSHQLYAVQAKTALNIPIIIVAVWSRTYGGGGVRYVRRVCEPLVLLHWMLTNPLEAIGIVLDLPRE